jgi:hypothetical protein
VTLPHPDFFDKKKHEFWMEPLRSNYVYPLEFRDVNFDITFWIHYVNIFATHVNRNNQTY